MRYLLLLFVITCIISCRQKQQKVVAREGQPDIFQVENTDEEMNAAIEKARNGWDLFLGVIREKKYDEGDASVKLRYTTSDDGAEHIWASDIRIEGGDVFGIIDNVPENIPGLNLGDTVRITRNKVSDWVYGDQGVLRGGYTIRVMRDRMTPQERADFDREFHLIIKEE